MSRDDLLLRIGEETRSATLAYYAYMYTDREYVKGVKLYLREMHFLVTVGSSSDISMTELADKLEISQGAASQIASRLLKKGLISKIKIHDDKRYTAIALTESGKRVYSEYLEFDHEQRANVASHLDVFSEGELAVILKYETLVKEMCKGYLSDIEKERKANNSTKGGFTQNSGWSPVGIEDCVH